MKKAIIYARVSTDEQRDNYSISSQVDECRKYIEAKGYQLVGNQYVDAVTGFDAISGIPAFVDDYSSSEVNRPSLDAAYEYLKLYGFDVAVVFSVDRLDRNPAKFYAHLAQFKPASVEFVKENFDESYTGDFMRSVMAAAAKLDNDMRIERFNRGKRQKARRGFFVSGKPPMGYVKDRNSLGGLAIDPDNAELVKMIFDEYVNNDASIHGLAQRLNRDGEYKPRYSDKWNVSSLNKILRNPAYVGKVYYNKNINIDGKMKKRDKSEWIEINIPPMIDQVLFDKAQARLDESRDSIRKKAKRFYMLSGMVFCADCGKVYGGQAQRAGYNRRITDGIFYRHSTNYGHCRNHSISANLLDPVVWDLVQGVLLDPEKLKRGYDEALAVKTKTNEKTRERFVALTKEKEKLEAKLKSLTEMMLDPEVRMTKAEYLDHRKSIQSQIASTIQLMDQCGQIIVQMPTPIEFESLEKFSSIVKDVLVNHKDQITPQWKREILRKLHIKVLINKDETGEVIGGVGNIGTIDSVNAAKVRRPQHVESMYNKPLQTQFHAFGSIKIIRKY